MDNVVKFVSKQDIANLEHMNMVQHLHINHLISHCKELEEKVKHLELLLSNVSHLDVIKQNGPIKPVGHLSE